MVPVILSGGSGTRLWPLSREQYPKQFLPLVTESSMLQETQSRLSALPGLQAPVIVCNQDHRFMVAEQFRQINVSPQAILLEPVARNTAPAIALAALAADPESVLLVLAADHVISDIECFHKAILEACEMAEQGYLATFGIVPTHAETGYGYIKRGSEQSINIFNVEAFVEKPDFETAECYLHSQNYYWNSGMFAFKAGVFLKELEQYQPEILAACENAFTVAERDNDFIWVDKEKFSESPCNSIDYAVMEKTDKAVVVALDAGWNDVGSWSALWDVTEKDEDYNAVKGDVITVNSQNCFIHSESKLIATIGLNDTVIVETDDAVMVAAKDQVQNIKQVVDRLKRDERIEAIQHRKVYRPWGYYNLIDLGDRHKAKRIVVKPGAKLSLQLHHHRAEHWVVVKGTAKVLKEGESELITENESTYIPVGIKHRLENAGVIPLEMIEIQTGSYLGEDDIVRFDDKYGRAEN